MHFLWADLEQFCLQTLVPVSLSFLQNLCHFFIECIHGCTSRFTWKMAIKMEREYSWMHIIVRGSLITHNFIVGWRFNVGFHVSVLINRLDWVTVIGRVIECHCWYWCCWSHHCRTISCLHCDVLAVHAGAWCRRSGTRVADGVRSLVATSRAAAVDVNRDADDSDDKDEETNEADDCIHHTPHRLQHHVRWTISQHTYTQSDSV